MSCQSIADTASLSGTTFQLGLNQLTISQDPRSGSGSEGQMTSITFTNETCSRRAMFDAILTLDLHWSHLEIFGFRLSFETETVILIKVVSQSVLHILEVELSSANIAILAALLEKCLHWIENETEIKIPLAD